MLFCQESFQRPVRCERWRLFRIALDVGVVYVLVVDSRQRIWRPCCRDMQSGDTQLELSLSGGGHTGF
jgi:hypothetical protein